MSGAIPASSLVWAPWPEGHAKIEAVLRSWEGTKYLPGQRCKGVGVDCVRFVCGVLDDLFGERRSDGPKWPQDAAVHNREGAFQVMSQFLRIYAPIQRVRGCEVQPGDLLACGTANGGPGHAMLVGTRPGMLWHATHPRVCYAGYNGSILVHRIYRSEVRGKWLCRP